ncbi:hypothetical protein IWW45_006383, partial [Coemansia sp. RSA 485]
MVLTRLIVVLPARRAMRRTVRRQKRRLLRWIRRALIRLKPILKRLPPAFTLLFPHLIITHLITGMATTTIP